MSSIGFDYLKITVDIYVLVKCSAQAQLKLLPALHAQEGQNFKLQNWLIGSLNDFLELTLNTSEFIGKNKAYGFYMF